MLTINDKFIQHSNDKMRKIINLSCFEYHDLHELYKNTSIELLKYNSLHFI